MKSAVVAAAAAAMASGAAAHVHGRHANAHELFRRSEGSVCAPECTTIYTTYLGEPTLDLSVPVETASVSNCTAPTPVAVTVTTPGTYTVPAATTVLTETITTGTPATTYLPGTYTHDELVTTITVDSTVFYCPYTSVGAAVTTPAAVVTTPAAVVVSTPAVAVSVVSTAPAASATATSSGSSPTLGGGKWYAMTYTPYTSDTISSCKTADQVSTEIGAIAKAGFKAVRVYSTECDTLTNVGTAARANGIDMILGVYVSTDGCDYDNTASIKSQVDGIAAWAQWDLVPLIAVGNEARLSNRCTTSQLVALLTSAKTVINAAGYTGKWTVAETLNVWQDTSFSGAICDLVDYTGSNIHPFFNTATTAANAGAFVASQLEIIDKICTGKTGFNLECGWPTSGVCQGSACPGVAEQVTALTSIIESAGSRTVFFSLQNDLWKEAGVCECEKSWGCGSLFESLTFGSY